MLPAAPCAYPVARWSVLNPFEAALLRDFGGREDFGRTLAHALRRSAGGQVYLSLMPDGALWLIGVQGGAPAAGTALLALSAPPLPVSERSLALRIAVIDWRHCARRYDALAARRARYPMP